MNRHHEFISFRLMVWFCLMFVFPGSVFGGEIEVWVSQGEDDARESETGAMNLFSADLVLGNETCDQTVGIRFQNVVVPRGALITNAYIEFDVEQDANMNPVDLYIVGEASDDPAGFSATPHNISGRARTDQFIGWNPLLDWHMGEQHKTPDLRSVVQAMVGRAGWASGNAMVFMIQGAGNRIANSYDGPGVPPMLHLAYQEGHFSNISVDRTNIGAICREGSKAVEDSILITNTGDQALTYSMAVEIPDNGSWLTVSGTGSSALLNPGVAVEHTITYTDPTLDPGNYNAVITITGINTPNSPREIDVTLTVLPLPEAANCGSVPVYTRDLTSPAILVLLDVSSSMERMMNVSPVVIPHTPDLSSIVQEIVNRDGWQDDNSMAFIVTGTGRRTASSYEGNSGSAPLLHVEYNDGDIRKINIRVSQGSDDAEENNTGSMNIQSSDLEMASELSAQTIGIRFQNVAIPQGVIIAAAHMEFEIDEQQGVETNLRIQGQAHDNPEEFTTENHNISTRALTASTVVWNTIEPWEAGAQLRRIEIGKQVVRELVKDRSIAWGFGTFCSKTADGYTADVDYTKIHVGCRFNDDTQQAALQAAIAGTISHSGTPFDHAIKAARDYFTGNKQDGDGTGDPYNRVDCQPGFLMVITDGLGTGTVSEVVTQTNMLCDSNVTPIAVGFGIDNAVQIEAMAKISNERGDASSILYSLHGETGGVGQPFFAGNRQELMTALSTIRDSVKAQIFHGSAPAPAMSVNQGNLVITASFNAADWSGDVEALLPDPDTKEWTRVLWRASEAIPFSRNVFTIAPGSLEMISYSDLNLSDDNYFDAFSDDYFCKPLGDFIHSIPVIVGAPCFCYGFDGYDAFKPVRDPMVYIGANDGALHGFSLATGEEKWAFVPLNLQDKLNRADEPAFNLCGQDYCHQFFVDSSPQAADIYDGSSWKTILICGEGKGGNAYFALDITSDILDELHVPGQYLWQFRDDANLSYLVDEVDNDMDGTIDEADEVQSQLGETWARVSIDRIADGADNRIWGVFFGSGWCSADQENKQAYLYGIGANDKAPLWQRDGLDINRIKLSDSQLLNDVASPVLTADFEGDHISDSIYVGNRYGSMYRVSNIGRAENPEISKLFDFNPVCTYAGASPISAKAAYGYGMNTQTQNFPVWIYFGTGEYNTQADKMNTHPQYFLGLKDNRDLSRCYLYPFTREFPNPENPDVCGDLVALEARYTSATVTMGEGVTVEKQVRYIDGACSEDRSWLIQLYHGQAQYNGPGLLGSERVVAQPLVVGGIVFFTTYIPDSDVCRGQGKTWLFAVDYNAGCASTLPVFDLNGDGLFDESDTIPNPDDLEHPYIPAGISFEGGPGSKPVLGCGNMVFITIPDSGVKSVKVNLPALKVRLGSWKENTK
jgi:PilY1 beta-propeller domain